MWNFQPKSYLHKQKKTHTYFTTIRHKIIHIARERNTHTQIIFHDFFSTIESLNAFVSCGTFPKNIQKKKKTAKLLKAIINFCLLSKERKNIHHAKTPRSRESLTRPFFIPPWYTGTFHNSERFWLICPLFFLPRFILDDLYCAIVIKNGHVRNFAKYYMRVEILAFSNMGELLWSSRLALWWCCLKKIIIFFHWSFDLWTNLVFFSVL